MRMPCRKIALGTLAAFVLVAAAPTESLAQGYRRYHGHGYGRHGGAAAGAAVAAGILGALAFGALAASAYPQGPGYPRRCAVRQQPTYDSWGQFMGYQPVQVCY